MSRRSVIPIALIASLLAAYAAAGAFSQTAEGTDGQKPEHYPVDTPFYTLRGPEFPMIALIQTEDEVEYIGDYLDLDMKRARSALRLLGYVNFEESMLLLVNGGPMEGVMLRVEDVYNEDGDLHVVIDTGEPPQQYRDSEFSSPATQVYTPSLVSVIPRHEGLLVVHTIPVDWAASGDLRGVQLIIVPIAQSEEEPLQADTTRAD